MDQNGQFDRSWPKIDQNDQDKIKRKKVPKGSKWIKIANFAHSGPVSPLRGETRQDRLKIGPILA